MMMMVVVMMQMLLQVAVDAPGLTGGLSWRDCWLCM